MSGPWSRPVKASRKGMKRARPFRSVLSLRSKVQSRQLEAWKDPSGKAAAACARKPRSLSAIAGWIGAQTMRHHGAASASFSQFPRTAIQKASPPADPLGEKPIGDRLIRHCVKQFSVERLQFMLVEFRRGSRDPVEGEMLPELAHRGDGLQCFRGSGEHRERGHRHGFDARLAQAAQR